MFDETQKYKNKGHFFFNKGDDLLKVSQDVPELPGVYYILRLAKGRIDLVYIGKSGPISKSGKTTKQVLRGSINEEQDGIKRQEFFDMKMNKESIDGLDIYWFVTMDKFNCDLPGFVEGLLMQRHFELHGKLPLWNQEF